MIIWDIFTVTLCKTVFWVLRKTGRHGAALPGLLAEKLNPRLLEKLTTLPDGIIVISGTNGKTTTTHLVSEVLRRAGKKVFTNHSGSNMTRGLLASIVRFGSLSGSLDYDIAVLEIDEAYAAKLAPLLRPRGAILTNVLRDQLDRFGEIDHTAQLLATLAKHTTEVVVLNSTDRRLNKIAQSDITARRVTFGFEKKLQTHFPDDDALYASSNRALPGSYDYTLESKTDNTIYIRGRDGLKPFDVASLPGWHNALNLTATYALVQEILGATDKSIYQDLTPPYGRGEVVSVGKKRFVLQLVKNPAGFRTAMDVAPHAPALIVINDQVADGRDVSWLWDVDFSTMHSRSSIDTSGTRAYDIALRLKYEDIAVGNVNLDEKNAVKEFVESHDEGVLFLTYTAMLSCRKVLRGLSS